MTRWVRPPATARKEGTRSATGKAAGILEVVFGRVQGFLGQPRLVLLGATGMALSAAAAFSASTLWLRIVGVLAVLVGLWVLVLQDRASRKLRFEIQPSDWSASNGEHEYLIPRCRTGGRRSATVHFPLPHGGEEEVFADIHVLADGAVRIAVGDPAPSHPVVVYLS